MDYGSYREYQALRALAKRLTSYTPEQRARLTADEIAAWTTKALEVSDRYWEKAYVREAEGYIDCPTSVGDIYRDARDDGAPQHILDRLEAISVRAARLAGYDMDRAAPEPPW